MEDLEFHDSEQVDWSSLFDDDFPECDDFFSMEPPVVGDSSSGEDLLNQSPCSVSSWIGEIENMLMKDDNDMVSSNPFEEPSDSFFADLLLDCGGEGSIEHVDTPIDVDSTASNDGKGTSFHSDEDRVDGADTDSKAKGFHSDEDRVDGADTDSKAKGFHSDEDKVDGADTDTKHGEDANNHNSKKRRRQLRNRDAAVRSRERKKMYVRDLEIKSRYLEGECRRLGHLLQFSYAENQALRLSLQMGRASGASPAKQESAVLLLESLLLGSLLWFLGIMYLLWLPAITQPALEAFPQKDVRGQKRVALKRGGINNPVWTLVQSFVKSRRCRSAKTKMKSNILVYVR